MRTRNVAALIAALMLALVFSACGKGAEEKPQAAKETGGGIAWMGFTDGMAKAKATGKPVMVDFYTTWCKYCVKLEETTYKDPEIISILNSNFVAIKVNAEGTVSVMDRGKQMTERDLAASYKVTGYPTIWFFDGKGEPVGPVPGYSPPEDFKPILTFITSGSYAKGMKYAEYLKTVKK